MLHKQATSIRTSSFNPSKLSPVNPHVIAFEYSLSKILIFISFAGDYFDIDIYKPWEFNATFPVRTVFIPQLVVGLPYVVLKTLSPYTYHLFGQSLKTPYFFVIFPRLFMCILSFLSDYFLYKICCMYGQNYRARLVTYASSYVMFTYATRTLSNSIEMVLTAALLYLVSTCMVFSDKVCLISSKNIKNMKKINYSRVNKFDLHDIFLINQELFYYATNKIYVYTHTHTRVCVYVYIVFIIF